MSERRVRDEPDLRAKETLTSEVVLTDLPHLGGEERILIRVRQKGEGREIKIRIEIIIFMNFIFIVEQECEKGRRSVSNHVSLLLLFRISIIHIIHYAI